MMHWRQLLSARRMGEAGSEPVTAARSPYQKDWDRVVFSSAFRRLQDKTQVHTLAESDYVRTRLTHSLEVSSVGRSLGVMAGETLAQRYFSKSTMANSDAISAAITAAEFGHIVASACLAHDIGNPPFGHFGETVIRRWFADPAGGWPLIAKLPPGQRADFLHFDGNAQGFRILTRLQDWRDGGGLRLTMATLGAFTKYPCAANPRGKFGFFQSEAALFAQMAKAVGLPPVARPLITGRLQTWRRHPLAYLVEAADDICYRIVDWEDGYKLGRIAFKETEGALRALSGATPPHYREIEDQPRKIAYLRAKAIGRLIEQAVEVFLDVESRMRAGRFAGDLLSRTKSRPVLAEIAATTHARIFTSAERRHTEVEAERMVRALLGAAAQCLCANKRDLPIDLLDRPEPGESRYRRLLRVVDYVSGMTDSYALAQFSRLRGLA